MKKYYYSILAILLGLSTFQTTVAQDDDDGVTEGLVGFWEIDTPTGSFTARLDHITSASLHEYYIDGAVKVNECTVDTRGGMVARFYYLEPIGASKLAQQSSALKQLNNVANKLSDRGGLEDPEHIVTKHYPTTTHAKTAEYRLKKKASINTIYKHIRKVWAEQKGRGKANKITITE